jgi:hypothetical protein
VAAEDEADWNPGDPIDNVFVLGSGIAHGSWDPVRQAMLGALRLLGHVLTRAACRLDE